MKKNDSELLFILLHKFFLDYMPCRRNFSVKTISSYRNTFNDFRKYLEKNKGICLEALSFDDFSKASIFDYLMFLRNEKKNLNSTLNVKLAAFCSFLKFCSEEYIELSKYFVDVSKIHTFRVDQTRRLEFLNENQLKLLFTSFDPRKRKDRRNRFLVIFIYETGCRLQEVLSIRLEDLRMNEENATTVKVLGKGSKTRVIPLPSDFDKHVNAYLNEFHECRDKKGFLFYTVHNGENTQMKPGTVDAILKNVAKIARQQDASFPLNLHAHALRHTLAMNLYRRGMPISYIRDILGHSSIDTTSIYAHADDETKRKALESISDTIPTTRKNKFSAKNWKGHEQELVAYCGLA